MTYLDYTKNRGMSSWFINEDYYGPGPTMDKMIKINIETDEPCKLNPKIKRIKGDLNHCIFTTETVGNCLCCHDKISRGEHCIKTKIKPKSVDHLPKDSYRFQLEYMQNPYDYYKLCITCGDFIKTACPMFQKCEELRKRDWKDIFMIIPGTDILF